MEDIKILDCTLRDGGYYTKWDFSDDIIKNYLNETNKLPIDYIEIGYRSIPKSTYFGEFYYCSPQTLKKVKSLSSKRIGIMLNEKEVSLEDLKSLLGGLSKYIDLVRIAVDPANFSRSILLSEKIKQMGFEVGINLMYMSKWEQFPSLIDNLSLINEVADYLFLVDSFGGIFPDDVSRICKLVNNEIDIPYGFHGHNNLELALINGLTALDNGAKVIDSTITGMGRGAGNLKTELILTHLESKGIKKVDFSSISNITAIFENLQNKYSWGTNLPYMVSGANSLPQKEVMEWVTKRFFSYNSIIRALQNKKDKKVDNERFKIFKKQSSYKCALLVGGGSSVNNKIDEIKEFLKNNFSAAVIHSSSRHSKLFRDVKNQQYFSLVADEGSRLLNTFGNMENFSSTCILPPFPRKMGTIVPEEVVNNTFELKGVDFSDILVDTHTAIALQTIIELSIEEVFVVGYDGYANNNIKNHEMDLFKENEYLFRSFVKHTSMDLKSLTPTLYKSFLQNSIYSLL